MTVYYYSGTIDAENFLKQYPTTIQQLLTGNYDKNHLVHLQCSLNHKIYSYHLNPSERLLFTEHRGSLNILEHLLTEDYKQSRFLKNQLITTTPIKDTEKPCFSAEINHQNKPLYYYNKQFIALNPQQETISQDLAFPMIINGAAGSGKTLIALLHLVHQALSIPGQQARLLYVTKERGLTDNMRSEWHDGFAATAIASMVEFKTFDDLIPAHTAIFNSWFNSLKLNKKIPLKKADDVYQEFQICSGFSREHYCELGARQSSIPREGSARGEFYNLYQQYLSFLQQENIVDSTFHSLELPEKSYDFIVVDEAQNFSPKQLHELTRLSQHGKSILFCMDQHQNLISKHSSRVLLEQSFYSKNMPITTHTLTQIHRCSQKVGTALNRLLEINRTIHGGKADKQEALTMNIAPEAQPGCFIFMPSNNIESWIFEQTANNTACAIITDKKFVEEAQELFKSPLVFTPAESIGQEFGMVIVYKLLSTDKSTKYCKKIHENWHKLQTQSHSNLSKTKDNEHDFSTYAPWSHTYFIAASRAQHTLVFIENKTQTNAFFIEPFESIAHGPIEKITDDNKPKVQDWSAMARQQRQFGNKEIAERIEAQYLRTKIIAPEKIIAPKISNKLSAKLSTLILEKKAVNKIQQLLDDPRVDVNYRDTDRDGNSALTHCLWSQPPDLDVLEALLAHPKINVNIVLNSGPTPLMLAMQQNNGEIDMLLKHEHIDVNQKTLFRIDVKQKTLLSRTDVNQNTLVGKTELCPLALALGSEAHYMVAVKLLNHKKIKILEEHHVHLIRLVFKQNTIINGPVAALNTDMFFFAILKATPETISRCASIVLHHLSKTLGGWKNEVARNLCLNEDILPKIAKFMLDNKVEQFDMIQLLPPLMTYCRDEIWAMIQSPDTLEMTPEQYSHLLQAINGSHGKAENQQHVLYKILFKSRPKTNDNFFQPERGPTITALRELIENLNQKADQVQLTSG